MKKNNGILMVAKCYRRSQEDGILYPAILTTTREMLKAGEFISFTGLNIEKVNVKKVLGNKYIEAMFNEIPCLDVYLSFIRKYAEEHGEEVEEIDFRLFRKSRGTMVAPIWQCSV